ncbi:hypothetical protein DY000_02040243 [Brassica cretica]|uniref:Replication protein A 70 kDa DNA-binding subunit B/D first OB fold domain-containing protein n=1 Tax=Brassica cretica TaxID=69181 RepID=A0ABQ7BAM0_BRACR|nr:hypothetical protein DY000_02040243 [Brassica cretica]
MSNLTTFVPLTKLRSFKDNWRIQVKFLHSWKQNTPFAGDTFEMVLADQWGNKIHATSKRSLMQRIQRVFPIDSWGVIEHVTVTPAGGQYRTTNYKYKMVIAEDAVLSRSDLVDDRVFISLANYEEIENGTKKQAFLIDVIGRIHDLGDVQTVQVSGEDRKRVLFRLVDAEGNNLACCLWGTYAEQLEPFSLNGKDQTIICLIRLSNDDLSVALVPKPFGKKDGKRILYNWNDAEIKTIAEVAEANQLHLVVKDDSATCNVMLLGPVGKSIVGVDAEELWDGSYEEIEDPDILPEPILSLVGKSFCFGISISSDNVTNGSDTFVVLEVCSGDKVLTIQTDSQSNSDMVTTSSTMSSGSAMMLDQISSDECPTPITKRKDDDCDLQDLTSSSKKQCTKIIKEEKIKND